MNKILLCFLLVLSNITAQSDISMLSVGPIPTISELTGLGLDPNCDGCKSKVTIEQETLPFKTTLPLLVVNDHTTGDYLFTVSITNNSSYGICDLDTQSNDCYIINNCSMDIQLILKDFDDLLESAFNFRLRDPYGNTTWINEIATLSWYRVTRDKECGSLPQVYTLEIVFDNGTPGCPYIYETATFTFHCSDCSDSDT